MRHRIINVLFVVLVTMLMFVSCGLGPEIDTSLIPVRQDYKWGYINHKGEYVIAPQFDDAEYFSSGLAKIMVNGEIGYINRDGDYVIPAKYKEGTCFVGGMAFVVKAGCAPACINKKGETLFSLPDVTKVWAFSHGLAKVWIEGKGYGFVDNKGKFVIEPQFSLAMDFNEGLAAVKQGETDEWGFIDKTGKYVITPQFDHIKGHKSLSSNEPQENDYVTSDYYDISDFTSAFFADNAIWDYKKFLNKPLSNLIDDPNIGYCIKANWGTAVYCNKKLNISNRYRIDEFGFYPVRGEIFHENKGQKYNQGTTIGAISYKIDVLYGFDRKMLAALVNWLEEEYGLEVEHWDGMFFTGKNKSNMYFEISDQRESFMYESIFIDIKNEEFYEENESMESLY